MSEAKLELLLKSDVWEASAQAHGKYTYLSCSGIVVAQQHQLVARLHNVRKGSDTESSGGVRKLWVVSRTAYGETQSSDDNRSIYTVTKYLMQAQIKGA
jgi:hypothetical protein